MSELNVKCVERFAKDPANIKLAQEWAELRKTATELREQVNAVRRPIFERCTFIDSEGKPIEWDAERFIFDCPDTDLVDWYHDECDRQIREKFADLDLKPHCCPALRAEDRLLDTERVIVLAITVFLGYEEMPHTAYNPDNWRKLIDLFLSVTLPKEGGESA